MTRLDSTGWLNTISFEIYSTILYKYSLPDSVRAESLGIEREYCVIIINIDANKKLFIVNY